MVEGLKTLHAMNEEVDCGARVYHDQRETRWEPGYARAENEDLPDYMDRVLTLALKERTCPYFSQFIGGLSVADHLDFQRKSELDNKIVYLKQRILLDTLRKLHARFLDLEAYSPQRRGYEFQHLLKDLFRVYELNPIENIVVPGEQIDLVLTIKPMMTVMVEAKWESAPVKASEVSVFYTKLEARSPRIIGLIVSMSGLSKGAENAVKSMRQKRTIIAMDRPEIESVIEGEINFITLLEEKVRNAEELGSR